MSKYIEWCLTTLDEENSEMQSSFNKETFNNICRAFEELKHLRELEATNSRLSKFLCAPNSIEEIYAHIMKFREKYLRAWVAETGLKPSECELVEQRLPNKIILSVRKREL